MTKDKILVPHDGTVMSDKALSKAIELAKTTSANLLLLHVIEEIPVPPSLILGNDMILIKRAKEKCKEGA